MKNVPMRRAAVKALTPSQQDMLKVALYLLLQATQGRIFSVDQRRVICRAWDLVRGSDPPLEAKDKPPEPVIALPPGVHRDPPKLVVPGLATT